MRGLSSNEVLLAWEAGALASPVRRGLTLLASVSPGEAIPSLATLPVGERDARLLELRVGTLGTRLSSLAQCPVCGQQVQADFDTSDFHASQNQPAEPGEVNRQGWVARLRLPDSNDLEAAACAPDAEAARKCLLARCVLEARTPEGASAAAIALPEEFVTAIGNKLSAADPRADVRLTLDCPGCGHQWDTAFDIAEFFWAELQSNARRLLSEVHELASAYGWRQADILALTPARRDAYLGLVRG